MTASALGGVSVVSVLACCKQQTRFGFDCRAMLRCSACSPTFVLGMVQMKTMKVELNRKRPEGSSRGTTILRHSEVFRD